MKFSEIITQANALLQHRGRLSYRTLKLEFDLDDEQLDVLKEQLIDIEALAVDQDGKMLVWIGGGETGGTGKPSSEEPPPFPPPLPPGHLHSRHHRVPRGTPRGRCSLVNFRTRLANGRQP